MSLSCVWLCQSDEWHSHCMIVHITHSTFCLFIGLFIYKKDFLHLPVAFVLVFKLLTVFQSPPGFFISFLFLSFYHYVYFLFSTTVELWLSFSISSLWLHGIFLEHKKIIFPALSDPCPSCLKAYLSSLPIPFLLDLILLPDPDSPGCMSIVEPSFF